jgi:DNA-3-methyladenine glycosylase II
VVRPDNFTMAKHPSRKPVPASQFRKAVEHLKQSDPILGDIVEKVGPCRMEFGPPEFHSLGEAIVYQQLNGKAAITIFKRFAALAGEPLTPQGILRLSDEQMRSAGLSKQKTSYLRDMAERANRGDLDFSRLHEFTDDEVIAHLTQVKGVGRWTAHMFLMFTLQRPDVLPTDDFGLRMAMTKLYRKRKMPDPKQMERIARSWQPYRSVACWYLWRSLDLKVVGSRKG